MKNFLFGLLPVVIMLGCAKEMDPNSESPTQDFLDFTDDEIKFLTERQQPVKLDPLRIDRIITEVISMMEPEISTRSASRRTVAEIRPLTATVATTGATRTESTIDTLFHIANFTNGQGYCIVAADRRLPDEIICFVDRGSFPATWPDRPAENPGLALMMDAVEIYGRRSLARHRVWSDSVLTALLTRTGAASLDELPIPESVSTRALAEPYEPSWHFHRKVGPLLPVEWSQRSPFNTTVVENTPWSGTPVGCVALAAVQVMAYWKHPAKFHGLADDNIDWDELCRWSGPDWDREDRYGNWEGPMSKAPETTQKLIADILWHFGDDIGMKYGASNSTAYTSTATNLLANHGFSQARITSYSDEAVLGSIESLRPVLIDGASHFSVDGYYYSNAHAWVIDGYLEQRWWDVVVIDHHMYEMERFRGFFHNNFGWGGPDNGYYACGVFDANNNPDLPSSTRVEWMGEHYNYQFLLTVYTDIYK